jgi:VanZ family protein
MKTKSLLNNKKLVSLVFYVYLFGITYFILKPGFENSFSLPFNLLRYDKVAHFSFFFILGFLLYLNFRSTNFKILFAFIIFYGVLTEYLQYAMKFGRTAEIGDFIADVLGGFCAWILFRYLKQKQFIV